MQMKLGKLLAETKTGEKRQIEPEKDGRGQKYEFELAGYHFFVRDMVKKTEECEFPYKSRVMGTSEPLKPLKAPYMARNPVKWGFFRLKGQEIPLKI